MSEWRDIGQDPTEPLNAILFFANIEWRDQNGEPANMESPLRDDLERCELALWDGEAWVEQGTGHDVFEDWKEPHMLPTHWMPLPAPPLNPMEAGRG